MPPLMGNTIFLAALASLGSMLEGESLSNVFEILSILGHIIRLSSGYVQSMFRVCSEYVQSMFRVSCKYNFGWMSRLVVNIGCQDCSH